MRPRILIPVPTLADAAYNQRSWSNYADAVDQAGGEPLRLELGLSRRDTEAAAADADGFLLPGSPADVDPARFGADRDPATSPADPARESVDFQLLDHAERHGKPVLAICYGCQSLNVWRGGSLVQDVLPVPVNHSGGKSVAVAHAAVVAPDSLLATLVDRSEAHLQDDLLRLSINSSHHQAVSAPGTGLRVVARSPEDGVIEAIEADPTFLAEGAQPQALLLGVQWHPERSTDISATSRALFSRLVADASSWASASRAGAETTL